MDINKIKLKNMSYYFVAQIKINDFDEYKKYVDNSGDVFKKYKGEYLYFPNFIPK